MFYFLHIEKTAGTTLLDFFREIVDDKADVVWEAQDAIKRNVKKNPLIYKDKKIICGHYNYGIHSYVAPDEKSYYFSVVRDPLERILSWYSYQKHTPGDPAYELANKLDAEAFIVELIKKQSLWVNNFQSFRILNEKGPDPAAAWEDALKNINKIIALSSVDELISFNLGHKNLGKKKVSHEHVSRNELSQTVIDVFYELNEADLNIFKNAKHQSADINVKDYLIKG